MKILFILIMFLGTSCASANYGDPTRPADDRKVKKEINRDLNSRFNAPNR